MKKIYSLIAGLALALSSFLAFPQATSIFQPGGDLTGSWNVQRIVNGAVTLAKQAPLAANSIECNASSTQATPTACTSLPTTITLPASQVSGVTLTAGANVTISGTWPNITISSAGGTTVSSPDSSIAVTGSGTSAVGLTVNSVAASKVTGVNFNAGSNVTITGSWPNYTFNSTGGGGTGTVGTATAANQIPYYAAPGTTLTAGSLGNNLAIVGGVLGATQPINAQTGTGYTIQSSDNGTLVNFCNSAPVGVQLPQAGTTGFTAGFAIDTENKYDNGTNCPNGTGGLVTITAQNGSLINGSPTLTEPFNTGCTLTADTNGNYQISACSALGSGGTITRITSPTASIAVTNPAGPTVSVDIASIAAGNTLCNTSTVSATPIGCPTSKVRYSTGNSVSIAPSDNNSIVDENYSGAWTASIPQAGSSGFPSGSYQVLLNNSGLGTGTITASSPGTINGATSITLSGGMAYLISADSSSSPGNYKAVPLGIGSNVGVAFTDNSGLFAVSGSPGNSISIAYNTVPVNVALMGPTTGSAAAPTFRTIQPVDLSAATVTLIGSIPFVLPPSGYIDTVGNVILGQNPPGTVTLSTNAAGSVTVTCATACFTGTAVGDTGRYFTFCDNGGSGACVPKYVNITGNSGLSTTIAQGTLSASLTHTCVSGCAASGIFETGPLYSATNAAANGTTYSAPLRTAYANAYFYFPATPLPAAGWYYTQCATIAQCKVYNSPYNSGQPELGTTTTFSLTANTYTQPTATYAPPAPIVPVAAGAMGLNGGIGCREILVTNNYSSTQKNFKVGLGTGATSVTQNAIVSGSIVITSWLQTAILNQGSASVQNSNQITNGTTVLGGSSAVNTAGSTFYFGFQSEIVAAATDWLAVEQYQCLINGVN